MIVKLSKKATLQINDSLLFLAKASKEAAENLFNEITKKLNSISEYPYLGPSLIDQPIKSVDMRKIDISNGRYGLIYSVFKDYIYVYYFIDFRMNDIITSKGFEKL